MIYKANIITFFFFLSISLTYNNNTLMTNVQLNGSLADPWIVEQVANLEQLSLPQVLELKSHIESELDRNFDRLKGHGADLSSPLITEDGFPRQDIDVLEVRLLRNYLNMLRNDLRAVIDRSQPLLATHFQSAVASQTTSTPTAFAEIYGLIPRSPMHSAGCQNGDKLVSVASVNATNHSNLSFLQQTIQGNANVALPLRILREGQVLDLTVTPTDTWGGSGLLGARFKLI